MLDLVNRFQSEDSQTLTSYKGHEHMNNTKINFHVTWTYISLSKNGVNT